MFFHGWAQAPREKTKTCPREAILAGASDDEHFGDLFITKNVRLSFITAAGVHRRRFTTVSTSSRAANSERADISNRPNFAHEQCRSVHPRVCGWKWLYQVVLERVCAHRLRVVNSFAN